MNLILNSIRCYQGALPDPRFSSCNEEIETTNHNPETFMWLCIDIYGVQLKQTALKYMLAGHIQHVIFKCNWSYNGVDHACTRLETYRKAV